MKKGSHQTKEARRKMSLAKKGRPSSFKGKRHTEETKKKLSEASSQILKGRPAWNKGLTKETDERVRHHSQAMIGKKHSEERVENYSKKMKEWYRSQSGLERKEFLKKKMLLDNPAQTPEARAKISKSSKNLWKDEEFVRRVMKSKSVSPNKLEISAGKLFKRILPEPNGYLYVGDGKLIVNGKCPDFVHVRKRLLIEIFGSHWHEPEEIPIRRAHFEEFGYRVLFLWDYEFKDKEKVMRKVIEFTNCERR